MSEIIKFAFRLLNDLDRNETCSPTEKTHKIKLETGHEICFCERLRRSCCCNYKNIKTSFELPLPALFRSQSETFVLAVEIENESSNKKKLSGQKRLLKSISFFRYRI